MKQERGPISVKSPTCNNEHMREFPHLSTSLKQHCIQKKADTMNDH